MGKEIKLYGADIYNDMEPRISLGARFLGVEKYIGICKKADWETPIIVSMKNNKLIARPIIIDMVQDSYYCYATDTNINSILSVEDIQYLNRIVNQSIDSGVPLIEISDKLDIDENIIFNHSIQCIDKRAFKAFSQEKLKNPSMNMLDFVKKNHENSDIKKVHMDIEKIITNRKLIVDSTKGFNVISSVKPVSLKEIRDIYASNGFYNVNKEEMSDIIEKINSELAEYLIETIKERIVNDIAAKRIKNNYKGYITEDAVIEYLTTNQIKFIDDVEQKVVKEILSECNNKDKVNNLFVANNLVKQYGNELGKELGEPYTLAVGKILHETKKTGNANTTLTESSVRRFSDNPVDINSEDVLFVANALSDDISMSIASEIKMDIVFDLTEQYNQGRPFNPITEEDLKSKYNINDKVAQKLSMEINTMVKGYIENKEIAKANYKPYILDGFEEETTGKSR